jgi:hypothetical protein
MPKEPQPSTEKTCRRLHVWDHSDPERFNVAYAKPTGAAAEVIRGLDDDPSRKPPRSLPVLDVIRAYEAPKATRRRREGRTPSRRIASSRVRSGRSPREGDALVARKQGLHVEEDGHHLLDEGLGKVLGTYQTGSARVLWSRESGDLRSPEQPQRPWSRR